MMDYELLHEKYKVKKVSGRYVNLDILLPFFSIGQNNLLWKTIGYSVQKRPIFLCELGHGKTKVLIWSQMHGNESTTTKGLIDFINLVQQDSALSNDILGNFTFQIIPMLNPDGSEVYTRNNANDVDLNRDFQNLTQPESRILMHCYNSFKPDYCYNLHDQRTIFGVEHTGKPATMSFLAPSYNNEKDYDDARLRSVGAIMIMVRALNNFIPEQIGRFDDGFNINCAGDAFQSLKTPTILIEAGHFPTDYAREETRKFVFIALLSAFYSSVENDIVVSNLADYLKIPQNMPNFFDFVYKNVTINYDESILITNFAVQFREILKDNKIFFNGFIAKVGSTDGFYGHVEVDCNEALYSDSNENFPLLDQIANFSIDNKEIFVNGLVKNQ